MVKGNTHLFSADMILKKIKNKEIKKIINSNIDYYYLGSVIPDSFFFHNKEDIKKISDSLHGKDGNLTNKIIFNVLDKIKKTNKKILLTQNKFSLVNKISNFINKDKEELAFIFGYITHCALDIIFHPIIYFLSGNYYDKDKEKRDKTAYLHYNIETYIDNKVNNSFFVQNLVKVRLINDLSFTEVIMKNMNAPLKEIKRALRRQIFFNKLFRSESVFNILYLLNKTGIVYKKNLSLFYGNLKKEKIELNKIQYKDLISGKAKQTNLNKLFTESFYLASQMINSAYDYYCNNISKKQCSKVISGKSLDTGKLKVPVSRIKYTLK